MAKFLEEGHKVKITIMFRGREVFHPELGKKILDRIAEQMDGMGKSEAVPRLDGRNMVMVLAPDKRAKQSAASRGPAHEGNGAAPKGRPEPAVEAAGPQDRVAGAEVAGSERRRQRRRRCRKRQCGRGDVGGPSPGDRVERRRGRPRCRR